jgi:hypothetical protein
MYRFHSKLECVLKAAKVTDNEKTLAYYKICSFSVNYTSIMFYSKGTRLKGLAGTNALAYLPSSLEMKKKDFYEFCTCRPTRLDAQHRTVP